MCEVMDKLTKEAREEGIILGEVRGETKGVAASIKNIMRTLNLPLNEAMDALNIAAEDREMYKKLVEA